MCFRPPPAGKIRIPPLLDGLFPTPLLPPTAVLKCMTTVPSDVSRHREGAGQLGAEGGERDQGGGGEDGHGAVVGLVGQLEKGVGENGNFLYLFLSMFIVGNYCTWCEGARADKWWWWWWPR